MSGWSKEAAEWLVDNRNIYGAGSDTMSFDPGNTTAHYAHVTLLSQNIYGLENVNNLGMSHLLPHLYMTPV